MSIVKKVNEVELLFAQLDVEIAAFQSTTKLSCKTGCGRCCTHNQIDASPLEFLPWAYHLYINGEANDVLETLNEDTSRICHIYNPTGAFAEGMGTCGEYRYRGLICRLFGYGATHDKYGKLRLATCTIIKEDQALIFHNAEKLISEGLSVPVFTHYYMRLSQIDFQLGKQIVPVNTALKLALEEVLGYYAYRGLEEEVVGVA